SEQARKLAEQQLDAVRSELTKLEHKQQALAEQARAAAQPAPMAQASAAVPATFSPVASPTRGGLEPGPGLPVRIESVGLVDEPARSSVVLQVGGGAVEYRVERVPIRKLVLTVAGAQLAEQATRTIDATEYLGPIARVEARRDGKTSEVQVTVELVEEVASGVRRAGSKLYWD